MPDQPPERRPLPSLDTLLDLVRDERSKQINHFDALDSKAGVVLGFAGLLIVIAPDLPLLFLIPAVLAALVGAGCALMSLWLRPYGALLPTPLRKYLAAEDVFTRRRVLDTLELLVNRNSDHIQSKGRWLTAAVVALGVAALLFAAGILIATVTEATMADQPQPEPQDTSVLPPPPEPDPDPELIGWFERGYPGPRETGEAPTRG